MYEDIQNFYDYLQISLFFIYLTVYTSFWLKAQIHNMVRSGSINPCLSDNVSSPFYFHLNNENVIILCSPKTIQKRLKNTYSKSYCCE